MVEYKNPKKKKVQLDANNNPIVSKSDILFESYLF